MTSAEGGGGKTNDELLCNKPPCNVLKGVGAIPCMDVAMCMLCDNILHAARVYPPRLLT